MFRVRTVLFCLIGVMLAGLTVGLVRFHHLKRDPEAALALLPENSDVSLDNVHHVATREGVKEWSLDAESVRYNKLENRSILKGVTITFFLKNGETVQVTGHEGVFFTDTKNMVISGNVVVRNGSNEMTTERLRYDHKSRAVSTDAPIVMQGDGVRLTGNNMIFSFVSEQTTLWGDVDAVIENFRM